MYNIHEGLSKYFLTLHKHNSLPLWPIRAFISSHYLKSSMSKLSLSLSLSFLDTRYSNSPPSLLCTPLPLSLSSTISTHLSPSLSLAPPPLTTLSPFLSLSLSPSNYTISLSFQLSVHVSDAGNPVFRFSRVAEITRIGFFGNFVSKQFRQKNCFSFFECVYQTLQN